MDDENLVKEITKIKGIGPWTAQCYMLASLNRDDVWPVADLGLMEAVKRIKRLKKRPSEEDMEKISQIWRPYRSTCLLYTSPSPRDMRRSRMPSSA